MERACSLVTAVRFLTAKNGVDYKFSLHFLPGLWYTCLRNKCHAISTICLQLRESVGCRYRRCVLCSYLEEALTHTVTHTTKRMDGNSGEDRAYLPQYTERKASKSLKKQQAECPDTLRNQQVMCSSHTTSSKKALKSQGLIVVRNYKSCGWGRERCDRKGHAVFLRPRVDSAIMGSASTGISTSSTKLKKISTFCRRLPPDLSGA